MAKFLLASKAAKYLTLLKQNHVIIVEQLDIVVSNVKIILFVAADVYWKIQMFVIKQLINVKVVFFIISHPKKTMTLHMW